jgi:hypothetical protein
MSDDAQNVFNQRHQHVGTQNNAARDINIHNYAQHPHDARHQLRAPVNDFVGREREIDWLTGALTNEPRLLMKCAGDQIQIHLVEMLITKVLAFCRISSIILGRFDVVSIANTTVRACQRFTFQGLKRFPRIKKTAKPWQYR